MSSSRQSFGGRPPRHPFHPNPRPRGDGPEFNQQAGFFRPHPTNGPGPRNHGETGNPWHINRNRNMNGGRWENGHQGQRRGPRPNNGQEVSHPFHRNCVHDADDLTELPPWQQQLLQRTCGKSKPSTAAPFKPKPRPSPIPPSRWSQQSKTTLSTSRLQCLSKSTSTIRG